MDAEIIAIGTELTTGAKLDTNSQWLSLALGERGIPVRFHSSVADNLEAMVSVLRVAVNRSDLVLITGGIGPTLDDLTRQALAELAQVPLELHQPSLDFIRSFFARHRREMPERNRQQAMFPAGAEPLPNPQGTAPGIWIEVGRKGSDEPCLVAAMPGVPSEMQRMFAHEVVPRLALGESVIQNARIHCFGVGESKAEEILGDLTARNRDPEIGITVHEVTITLRITSKGRSAAECREKIELSRVAIHQQMGNLVFGEEEDELEHVVVRLLNQRQLTLSTVEIGSGGILVQRLSAVAESATCFRGGLVLTVENSLHELLGFDDMPGDAGSETDDRRGEILQAAATACRNRFGTDFSIAVGSMPVWDSQNSKGEVPHGHVAISSSEFQRTSTFTPLADSAVNKVRAMKIGLNMLRLHLLGAD